MTINYNILLFYKVASERCYIILVVPTSVIRIRYVRYLNKSKYVLLTFSIITMSQYFHNYKFRAKP